MPLLTIIAGPNGSGKSSFTALSDFEGITNLLDPDAVAKRIDPEDPARAAIAAAKEVIRRTREYLDGGESFTIETTLAGRNYIETMEEAKLRGFSVRLVFICLDRPDRNVRRVWERKSKGGHNSGPAPRRVFEARNGTVTWRAASIPDWAAAI